MLKVDQKIECLHELGKLILQFDTALGEAIQKSFVHNPWFTSENIEKALRNIAANYLEKQKLVQWMSNYETGFSFTPKTIGMVMAGNIPLVGMHDIICCFLSGHHAAIKLSDKDKFLLPFLVKKLVQIEPQTESYFSFRNQLKNIDAIIATGSNNTAIHFEYYFRNYPKIIRKNRNGIAVLDGRESREELSLLGNDIFSYFGMGCRNVSKIYVPPGYKFDSLMDVLEEFQEIIFHYKYKNNFDYNYAVLMLNKENFLTNGCLILREHKDISSRISSLHYENYETEEKLVERLVKKSDEIQCIVSHIDLTPVESIEFGSTQIPALDQYADGVDVMKFLIELGKALDAKLEI